MTRPFISIHSTIHSRTLRALSDGLGIGTLIAVSLLVQSSVALVGAEPSIADTVPSAWKTFVAAGNPVRSVQWTPDEQHVVATSSDGWCRVWSVETGKVVKQFPVKGGLAVLLPDGEQLAVTDDEKKDVVLYRWSTGDVVRRFATGSDGTFWSLGVSPAGDRIAASTGQPGIAYVWDVSTAKLISTLKGHAGRITAMRFVDGRSLFTGGDGNERVLWTIDTGKDSVRWTTPEFDPFCIDMSSDNRYLAEAGSSNEAIVRESATGKIVATLRHDKPGIVNCQFLKDLPMIATSGFDKTIRIWDITDGRELFSVRNFRHYQYGMSISKSGTRLAAGSGIDHRDGQWWNGEDFNVRLWKLPKTIWRHRTGSITLAVLEFETTGTSPSQARLRETLADGIVQSLSNRGEVRVLERNSAAFLNAEKGLKSGFTNEAQPAAELETAEVLLSGTLAETDGKLDVTVLMHVVGRTEPIARWNLTGTVAAIDDVRRELTSRLMKELDLPAEATQSTVLEQPRIAVLPFRNQTGEVKLDAWADGIADLLTSTLSDIPTVSLVERQALDAIMREQKLQAAQLTDPSTAIRLGRLASADWAVIGSLSGSADKLKVSIRVIDVASSRILKALEREVVVAQIDKELTAIVAELIFDTTKKQPGAKPAPPTGSTRSLEYVSIMARAQRLAWEKKTDEAMNAYEQAILLNKHSLEAHLRLLRCQRSIGGWSKILETAQSARQCPEFGTTHDYLRYEIANLEIDALMRLKRPEEIRRRGPDWEKECGSFFQNDISSAWKFAAGIRPFDSADSQQFAAEVKKHDHHSEQLRAMYSEASRRKGNGPVEKQISACQDVTAILDHVLDICANKQDEDAKRWGTLIIPTAIIYMTYYARQGGPHVQFFTVDQKIERLQRALEVFGWIPETRSAALASLVEFQLASRQFDAAAETYLTLARAPFVQLDTLPSSLDQVDGVRWTLIDRRISGWTGWAQMRAKTNPELAQSALETALAEVGAVHDSGAELIAAAADAKVSLRWPRHLALIWGGGHTTWESWRNVLAPLGLRTHPARRIGIIPADLEPYELVVLVRSGPMVLLPSEILALRSHVARGGRLLVVLSPGWDAAQPAVYRTLLDVFGFGLGEPTEVRTLSTSVANHRATQGMSVMAKCAVDIKAPAETRLIVSGDRCLLAAKDYRAGRIAVASFGQWFTPDASVYGESWERLLRPEAWNRPHEELPFASGGDSQRLLLDQLLKWMLTPLESAEAKQSSPTVWHEAAAAVRQTQAGVKKPNELPGILDALIESTTGSIEREEAVWFAAEASQGHVYFFKSDNNGERSVVGYGLGRSVNWPSQPELYDRLLQEFPNSELRELAQYRKAESIRRNHLNTHASRGDWNSETPYDSIIEALEKVESKPGRAAWAWQQLRLGRLKHALKLRTNEGLNHLQAVADQMPPSPEKGLAIQAIAIIQLHQGHRDEARRSLELLLTDIPDFSFYHANVGGYERWRPMDDTLANYLSGEPETGAHVLGGPLRFTASQQLGHMNSKK